MDRPDPERIRRVSVRTLMAPLGVVALLVGVVGIGLSWSDGRHVRPVAMVSTVPTNAGTPSAADPTASLSSTPSAAQDARPPWVLDLAGQLECDAPRADLGSEVVVPEGPVDPVPTTDRALRVLLNPGVYASLPLRGFEPARVDGHWVLYRYAVGGRLKAIAVGTDQFGLGSTFGWEVVGVRACDASEFDPADGLTDGATLWVDRDGHRVRADRIFSRPGSAHCGWERAVLLEFDGRQFLRDPKHVLAEATVVAFDATSRLPADVVDTGLHTERWHLFTIPSGRAVFIRTGDGRIELWPRAREAIGCM